MHDGASPRLPNKAPVLTELMLYRHLDVIYCRFRRAYDLVLTLHLGLVRHRSARVLQEGGERLSSCLIEVDI